MTYSHFTFGSIYLCSQVCIKKWYGCCILLSFVKKNFCCIQSLSGHTTAVECVQFNGSEELVCAGSQSGSLKIWDLEAAKSKFCE